MPPKVSEPALTSPNAVPDFAIQYKYSEWQKKRVRTLTVNIRSRNPAERSIASAISQAEPGDRIEVIGGEYHECISIIAPVEIVASQGERPIVTFRGAALQCAAPVDAVLIQGMTFLSRSDKALDYAVVVSNGTPRFEDCNMSSMHVTGHGEPTVNDCEISGSSNGIGIKVSGNGGGRFTHCRVHSHQDVCVSVDSAGSPYFANNNLFQNIPSMVVACEGIFTREADARQKNDTLSGAVFENNTIYQEQHAVAVQLVTATGDRSTIRGRKSTQGDTCCVYVAYGASPTFRQNEVTRGDIGFLFEMGGLPKLEANHIRAQRVAGARIYLAPADDNSAFRRGATEHEKLAFTYTDHRSVVIDGHNMFDRCKVGIDVVGTSSLAAIQHHHDKYRARRSDLLSSLDPYGRNYEGESYGVLGAMLSRTAMPPGAKVSDALHRIADFITKTRAMSGVTITTNRFSYCADAAIHYRLSAFGHVEECDFDQTAGTAVLIDSGSFPSIARCRIESSGVAAISAHHGADPFIIANKITKHKRSAVRLTDGCRGVLLDNSIENNEGVGVEVSSSSSATLCRNAIGYNVNGGLLVTDGARPTVQRNCLTRNGPFEIRVESHAHPIIVENEVLIADSVGVHFTTCSAGRCHGNAITDSRGHGLIVELDADPEVTLNDITKSSSDGVHVRNNGLGTFVNNNLADNCGFNLHIKEGADPVVRCNSIIRGLVGGIGVTEEGLGTIEKNEFSDNSNAHIVVDGKHSNPRVLSNGCFGGPSAGILCRNFCSGVFRGNRCSRNTKVGMLVETGAAPDVERCSFTDEIIGVVCDSNSAGVFRRNRMSSCIVAGLVIRNGAAPKVVDNAFHENRFCGVLLGDECCGMVLRNTLTNNALGFACSGSGKMTRSPNQGAVTKPPTVAEENTVSHNFVAGVLLESGARGQFINNTITENDRWGILGHVEFSSLAKSLNEESKSEHQRVVAPEVARIATHVGGGTASFLRNIIKRHHIANIGFVNHPVANDFTFDKNEVSEATIGIAVESASVINLTTGNTISKCGTGILCSGTSRGNFERNVVSHCRFASVHVTLDAHPQFGQDNMLIESDGFGVFVEGRARGSFTRCTITNNALAGVAIAHSGNGHRPVTRFVQNAIESNGLFGVVILPPVGHARAIPYPSYAQSSPETMDTFDDTTTLSNVQQVAKERHGTVIEDNSIASNGVAGVYVAPKFGTANASSPTRHQDASDRLSSLHPSSFTGSPQRGNRRVVDHRGAAPPPFFVTNTVEDNAVGVIIDANADPILEGNKIVNNRFFGLVSRPFACPTVRKNEFRRNVAVGLFCAQQAKGLYENNTIVDNNSPSGHTVFLTQTAVAQRNTGFEATRAARRAAWGDADGADEVFMKRARALLNDHEPTMVKTAKIALFYGSASALRLGLRHGAKTLTESATAESAGAEAASSSSSSALHVHSVGIWLEQGCEVSVETNDISGHKRCGLLYSTLALLDGANSAKTDGPSGGDADDSLAHSSSQTMAAGGGCIVKGNRITKNETDGVRLMSVVRAEAATAVTLSDMSTTRQAAAQGAAKARRKSVVGFAAEPSSPTAAAPAPSSSSFSTTDDDLPSIPPVEVMMSLDPPQRPPQHAVLVMLDSNTITSNGRYGVYVEQLFYLDNNRGRALTNTSANGGVAMYFEPQPVHRLVLPPMMTRNTFKENAAAAVCVKLATQMDGDDATATLLSPSTATAPAGRRQSVTSLAPSTPPFGATSTAFTNAAAGAWYYAPQLVDNTFETSDIGVLVESGGNAVLAGNTFARQGCAVYVRDATTCLVAAEANHFSSSTVGVRMEQTLTSKVLKSTFDLHTDVAILVRDGACPIVARNTFRAPKGSNQSSPARDTSGVTRFAAPEPTGLVVKDSSSSPIVALNTFEAMRLAVYVSDFAGPKLWRNRFNTCHIGCSIDAGGEGFYQKNYFVDSSDAGIVVSGSSTHPLVHECVFEQCNKSGLRAYLGAGGRVQRCWFKANQIGLIADDAGTHFQVAASVITENSHVGVLVRSSKSLAKEDTGVLTAKSSSSFMLSPQNSSGAPCMTVTHSFFESNAVADMTFNERGVAYAKGNVFMGTVASGDGAEGIVEGNRFLGAVERAAVLEPAGATTFKDNIYTNAKVAMAAMTGCRGVFESNLVFGCAIGIDAEKGSGASFQGNMISAVTDCGAKAAGSTLQGNDICAVPVGIVIAEGQPQVVENTIRECVSEGILVSGGGSINKNVISNCRYGIRVLSTVATPHVCENFVMDCFTEGVVLGEMSRCTFANNDVFDNGTCSLAALEGALCTIDGNRISSPNDRSAFDLHPDAKCIVRGNTIRNQFSPAYKKALVGQRNKDLKKALAAVQARIATVEGATKETTAEMRKLVDAMLNIREEMLAAPRTPPGLQHQHHRHYSTEAFRARSPTDASSGGSSRSATPPSTSQKSSFRRRAASVTESPSTQRTTSLQPGIKRTNSAAKFADVVMKVRAGASQSSSTASKVKAAKQSSSGRICRVLVHRFTNAKGTASNLVRDLGNQFLSASDVSTDLTAIASTSKDPVASVVKTSSCDALLVVMPPVCETLSEDELQQLTALGKFVKARNLASLAVRSTSSNDTENVGSASAAKARGVLCMCVVSKFFLSTSGALFTQPAVLSFLRSYGVLVDDGSTGFLQELVASMQRLRDDTPAEVKSHLMSKFGLPEGFLPDVPKRTPKSQPPAVEADGAE